MRQYFQRNRATYSHPGDAVATLADVFSTDWISANNFVLALLNSDIISSLLLC